MAHIGLDTTQHERTAPTGGTPLPAGMYHGVITRTQLKDTKDGTGAYLEVEYDISHPSEYGNRKFWDRFNIQNKSAEATRIGKEQLSDLAKAAGLKILNEDTDLHGKEVAMVLRVRPPKDQFSASNECDKYWPVGTTLEQHEAWRGKKASPAGAAAATAKPAWGAKPAAAETTPHTEKKKAPWGAK